MSPLDWLYLSLYFLLIFFLMMLLIYFMIHKKFEFNKINKLKKNIFKLNW